MTMPAYRGVEVWLEDSERRKLNHEHVSIDLVDDNSVTLKVKTKMLRDELYTVHCLSPISIFCEVFVTLGSRIRRCAARFYTEKSLSISDNASGSSVGHMEDNYYKDIGLRTPKRAFQHGKLGTVEVEIRRTATIAKEEPTEDRATDEDEQGTMVFSMIDDFDHPPWLHFVFDINAKGPPQVISPSTTKQVVKQVPHKAHKIHREASSGSRCTGISSSNKTSQACAGQNPPHILHASPSLQQEYEKEKAEERRLLEILQERLKAKRTSNMELRRLLEEPI